MTAGASDLFGVTQHMTLCIYIPRRLAESFYVQGWHLSVWRTYPHRAYSLLAWRDVA